MAQKCSGFGLRRVGFLQKNSPRRHNQPALAVPKFQNFSFFLAASATFASAFLKAPCVFGFKNLTINFL
jgi:hypothetical protein